jgi:hypothetical protein
MKSASPSVIQTNAAGAVTRRRIIDVAERLFADRGIDGVPLKQIATAAGQANVNAIQYHFGSKSGSGRASTNSTGGAWKVIASSQMLGGSTMSARCCQPCTGHAPR